MGTHAWPQTSIATMSEPISGGTSVLREWWQGVLWLEGAPPSAQKQNHCRKDGQKRTALGGRREGTTAADGDAATINDRAFTAIAIPSIVRCWASRSGVICSGASAAGIIGGHAAAITGGATVPAT